MNDFPLAPFLIALSTDGIPVTLHDYDRILCVLQTEANWTLAQFENVLMALLAHNEEQTEIFRRRFANYFDRNLPLTEKISDDAIRQALNELAETDWHLFAPPIGDANRASENKPVSNIKKAENPPIQSNWRTILRLFIQWAHRRFSVWHLAGLLLAVGIVFGFWRIYFQIPETPPPPVTETQTLGGTTLQKVSTGEPDTVQIDKIGAPQSTRLGDRTFYDALGVLMLSGFPVMFILLFSALTAKGQREQPPEIDPTAPRIFPLHQIGGRVKPWLDSAEIDSMSDLLSYFLSDNPSRRLDVSGSVLMTVRNAGLPVLQFEWLKQVRRVYIFEDAYAEPLVWNQLARELAEGLARRGVNARYGRFYDAPDKFQMTDGESLWLEDLETFGDASLLIFFSDGKRLNRTRDRFTLEKLARSSSVVWLDLREKLFWDEGAQFVSDYDIPLYEANAGGLARALRRFLSERNLQADDSADIRQWLGQPPFVNEHFQAYLENLLGEALAWAQACAMIQPVTIAMAGKLRERFAPQLPVERIERLFRLPGSSWNASGLRFSLPVLAVLRKGFAVRWETAEQEAILDFILEQIRLVEPPEKNSLRHLMWEWSLERVRVEIDPDRALKNIARLTQTPLKNAIRNEFSNLVLPGEKLADKSQIPLRTRPATADGLNHFQKLADRAVKLPDLKFFERLSAERHRLVRFFKSGWLGAKRLADDLQNSVRDLLRRPETFSARADAKLMAEPAELKFGNLRSDREATRRLVFKSLDRTSLTGQIESDRPWISIERSLVNGRFRRHTATIRVSTNGLGRGLHAGRIVFASNDGERIDVPVSLVVVRSWREAFREWWQENRPSRRLGLLLTCLLIALTVLFVSERTLAHNWLNHLFNQRPELVKLDAALLNDKRTVLLTATANDPDGNVELLGYQWETDRGTIDGVGNTARIENIELADLPADLRVKIKLTDEHGGRSVFETSVNLNKIPSADPDAPTTAEKNDSPNSTADPTAPTKKDGEVIPVVIPGLEDRTGGDIPTKIVPKKNNFLNPDYAFRLELELPPSGYYKSGDELKINVIGEGQNFNVRGAVELRLEYFFVCEADGEKLRTLVAFNDMMLNLTSKRLDPAPILPSGRKYDACTFSSGLYNFQEQFLNAASIEIPLAPTKSDKLSGLKADLQLRNIKTGQISTKLEVGDSYMLIITDLKESEVSNNQSSSAELKKFIKRLDGEVRCLAGNEFIPVENFEIYDSAIEIGKAIRTFNPGEWFKALGSANQSQCNLNLNIIGWDDKPLGDAFRNFSISRTDSLPCPRLLMSSSSSVIADPKAMLKPNEEVSFSVRTLDGREFEKIEWTVTGGVILSGQGTPQITVKVGAETSLTVAYKVFGLPENCNSTKSILLPTESKATPIKVLKDDNPPESQGPISDRVKIRATVNEKGVVTDVDVVGKDGPNSAEAKKRVDKNWRFSPAVKNGQPVKDTIEVEVIFRDRPTMK